MRTHLISDLRLISRPASRLSLVSPGWVQLAQARQVKDSQSTCGKVFSVLNLVKDLPSCGHICLFQVNCFWIGEQTFQLLLNRLSQLGHSRVQSSHGLQLKRHRVCCSSIRLADVLTSMSSDTLTICSWPFPAAAWSTYTAAVVFTLRAELCALVE